MAGRFPGALAPATEFIPYGDKGRGALASFSAACEAPPFRQWETAVEVQAKPLLFMNISGVAGIDANNLLSFL